MAAVRETTERVADLAGEKYKYGFVTDIEMVRFVEAWPEQKVSRCPLHLFQKRTSRNGC